MADTLLIVLSDFKLGWTRNKLIFSKNNFALQLEMPLVILMGLKSGWRDWKMESIKVVSFGVHCVLNFSLNQQQHVFNHDAFFI